MFLNIAITLVGVERLLCLNRANLSKMELNRKDFCLFAAGSPHARESFFLSYFDCDALSLEMLCKRASAFDPWFCQAF